MNAEGEHAIRNGGVSFELNICNKLELLMQFTCIHMYGYLLTINIFLASAFENLDLKFLLCV